RTFQRTKGFTDPGDIPEWTIRKQKTNYELNKTRVAMCRRLGCNQATGTDWNGSGPYELANEIWAMSELGGYSPLEALSCCTKIGAEVLGLERLIGTIEEGKLADLVLFQGNPLEDLRVLGVKEKIRLVMKGGEVIVNKGLRLQE
ncbi:MAG: amidohydrolase family protein, partial [Candidatus Bathyarchaeia archaeon]